MKFRILLCFALSLTVATHAQQRRVIRGSTWFEENVSKQTNAANVRAAIGITGTNGSSSSAWTNVTSKPAIIDSLATNSMTGTGRIASESTVTTLSNAVPSLAPVQSVNGQTGAVTVSGLLWQSLSGTARLATNQPIYLYSGQPLLRIQSPSFASDTFNIGTYGFPNPDGGATTNDVLTMGWNVVSGGRVNTSLPGFGWVIENNYGSAPPRQIEAYWQGFTTAGVAWRPIGAVLTHNGSGQFRVDIQGNSFHIGDQTAANDYAIFAPLGTSSGSGGRLSFAGELRLVPYTGASYISFQNSSGTTIGYEYASGSTLNIKGENAASATNLVFENFTLLSLGGTSSSFPAIKRSSTTLKLRLADDSADAPMSAGSATFSGNITTAVTASRAVVTDGSSVLAASTATSTDLANLHSSGFTGFANPSASLGLAEVNGSAATAMRSDAAPALSTSISPTMTGNWTLQPVSGVAITITNGSPSTKSFVINAASNTTGNIFEVVENGTVMLAMVGGSNRKTTSTPPLQAAGFSTSSATTTPTDQVTTRYVGDLNNTKGYLDSGLSGINWAAIGRVASNINYVNRGASGQTADLTQWHDSSANVLGSVGANGELKARCFILTKTTNYTVLASDTRTVFTNNGASGEVDLTLPTWAAGLNYTFDVETAQTLKVLAPGTDTIRIAGSASAGGGNVTNATIGGMVTIVATISGKWVAMSHEGTWTVN